MSDQILEVILLGLHLVGKTTIIQSVSQQTEMANDGWFSGWLPVEEGLQINFLEPPTDPTFDFMWLRELVNSIETDGYIIVFNSADADTLGEATSILQTVRATHPNTPLVIAANMQDRPGAWGPNDLRYAIGIPDSIPVVGCIGTEFDAVREVVLQLLYQIFGE